MKIYSPWCKGLPDSPAALLILRGSGIIAGVELSNIDDGVEKIQAEGLGTLPHNPGMRLMLNLADPTYLNVFEQGEIGPRLLQLMRTASAGLTGLHLGYAAERVEKMVSYANVAQEGIFEEPDRLIARMKRNLLGLDTLVNGNPPDGGKIRFALETLDYYRNGTVPDWDVQSARALGRRAQLEESISRYGVNAGQRFVTEPRFVAQLLHRLPQNIGLVLDAAHNLIAWDAKRHNGEYKDSLEDYFEEMFRAGAGRIFQMHLSFPYGNEEEGFRDSSGLYVPGEPLHERLMGILAPIVSRSPEMRVVTLEMDTGLDPVGHATAIVEQARLVAERLNLHLD